MSGTALTADEDLRVRVSSLERAIEIMLRDPVLPAPAARPRHVEFLDDDELLVGVAGLLAILAVGILIGALLS